MTAVYAHELQAGDRYEDFEFKVSADLNQQWLFAVEDFNPLYLHGQNGEPPLVHPVVLMQMSPRTRSPSFRQAPHLGSALARDCTTFLKPVRVGTRLRVQWVVTKTYEQRNKIYQDYVATLFDESNEEVMRREISSTFFSLDTARRTALEEKS
ncbi:hypothetical protein [Hydrogenophaga sp. BPS33]|uniref:hypothetical protein n=1 Tax=Hydrogenophaga sp. BPS33 TaxID=2651974 RepID=UPI00131FA03D|nr:hypothetical protein [Hydrogenophaga sp. BPS33]QHE84264.1 hypothetical protein F9K07_04850 [Hydrogenophaga sp. BPS33]